MAFIVTGGYWEDQGYWETYSNPSFDAGARTVAELTDDGFFTFSVEQATGIVCGLNILDSGAEETEILHGFYLESGRVRIVERGVFKTAFVSYTPVTSVFRVDRINGVVRYYKDDVLLYTSLTPSTGTVFLDCSLYSADDTILDALFVSYAQLHLILPKPVIVLEETVSLEISLSKPKLILLENDGQLLFDVPAPELIFDEAPDLFFSLPSPTLDLVADEDLTVTLPSPQLILWSEDESSLYIEVQKPALVLKERAITPDVSLLQFSIPQPRITLNEEENLSLDFLIPPPIIGLSDGYEYCHIELPQPLLGMTPAIMNFGILEWPQWNFTLIGGDSLSTLAWTLHTVSSGATSSVVLHRTSYQGSDRQEAILLHEVSMGGASGGGLESRLLHTLTYQSGSRTHAQSVNEAIYATFGLVTTFATHDALWSSASLAPSLSAHQASWSSAGASASTITLHDVLWSSRILTSTETLHTSEWASIGLSAQFTLHTSEWASSGGVTQQIALHESLWSSRILTSTDTRHFTTWASIGREFITSLNEVSWSTAGSLSAQFTVHTSEWSTAGGSTQQISLHDALWSSRILTPSLNIHDSLWASSGGITQQMTLHHSSWNSAGGTSQVINVHDALWSSRILSSSISAHDALWSSPGIQVTLAVHQSRWSSIGAQSVEWTLHQATWASPGTSSFVFSAHDTSWSVQSTLLNTHEQRWKSVIETSMIHHSAYETVDNTSAFQIHRLLWRSNQTAPIINTGLIYARI